MAGWEVMKYEVLQGGGTHPDDMESTLTAYTPPAYQLARFRGNPGLDTFEALLREGNPIVVLIWTGENLHWTMVTGTYYNQDGTLMVRFANYRSQTWDWFLHQWSFAGLNWPAPDILSGLGLDPYIWMRYEKTTTLIEGQAFDVGQENAIYSQDGRFMFFLDTAGHLILYPTPLTLGTALWHSPNAVVDAVALGCWVYMQPDGNLIIYDKDWHVQWDTGTDGHPGAYLAIQNDGNLVIYDANRITKLWTSNTGSHY